MAHLPATEAGHVLSRWTERQRVHRPASGGVRAAWLAACAEPLVGAIAWQRFLDLIEPDEESYHQATQPLAYAPQSECLPAVSLTDNKC